jgi:flagellin FlaB
MSDNAFTGLEAAIVLIAFVVVAAVFSYVVLGAGFYTTQKSQETVYKSVEQATSNIEVIGQIYVTAESTAAGGDTVEVAITLTPGAPTTDLTRMKLLFSTDITSPVQYIYGGTTADTSHFSAMYSGTTTEAPGLSQNEQVSLRIKLDPSSYLQANQVFYLEVRPMVGSAYTFSRTMDPVITKTVVL